MKFELIDEVLESSEDRLRAVKVVTRAEEYLGDHFPSFPVLPGVMMLEAMVQAARRLLAGRGDARLVLGKAKALKYGAMVRPGDSLEVEVSLVKPGDDGSFVVKGTGTVRRAGENASAGETAVSGRFTMRPIRTSPQPPNAT